METINASKAKYIKLGSGGEWQDMCLADGTARMGYYEVPHALGQAADHDGIKQLYIDRGSIPRTATSHARQVIDFYDQGADTLWITFANGYLYWAFLEPAVEFIGSDKALYQNGSRLRRTMSGWSNLSLGGDVLLESNLNGKLTSVKSYRATICEVSELDYLLDRINDREASQISAAKEARTQTLKAIQDLVALLGWRDFELLVELIFDQSGWRRMSETGGVQETVDIELSLPSTGERAFVQIKSRTRQAELDDYVARFDARSESRMFYVYHTKSGSLEISDQRVSVIGPDRLSEMILEAGLFDWLIGRAS